MSEANQDQPETIEIEAPVYLDDMAVRAYLKKIDADLDRLCLEDGRLWAYRLSNPDQLCSRSLDDQVAVAFPTYFKNPTALIVVPAEPAMVVPGPTVTPTPPTTGTVRPGGLLDRFQKRAGGGLPSLVDPRTGTRINASKLVTTTPNTVSIPLTTSTAAPWVLAGFATLPTTAYRSIRAHPWQPDHGMWRLGSNGRVSTRVKRNPGDPYLQEVDEFLKEHGILGKVKVRRLRSAAPA